MHTVTKNSSFMSYFRRLMERLGKVGKALMFPIAVLPIAAILLRIGADIPASNAAGVESEFAAAIGFLITKAGGIVFDNLPILFAIGLAFGFTKDNRGEAAFAGFIAMVLLVALMSDGGLPHLIYKNLDLGASVLVDAKDPNSAYYGFRALFGGKYNAVVAGNVLNGIIVGSITAFIYNRIHGVELPKLLAFFAGRRLVPAFVILAVLIFSVLWAVIFPWIGFVIYLISDALYKGANSGFVARASIMGAYGFINRLLIPFGLHHIPNNLFWFQLGSFPTGKIVDGKEVLAHGDIFVFLNGVAKDNPGGIFQAGFFPTMMFGLPAIVAAFYLTAKDREQKVRVLAMYGSAALVSFLSGITEPIEFAFMFVSPVLYFVHAVLTGVFAFITGLFGIQIGFGFSAGFMDYALSFPKSLAIIAQSSIFTDNATRALFAHPGWIIPIGAVCALTYFLVAYVMIKKLNLNTPGRGTNLIELPGEGDEVMVASGGNLSLKAKMIVLGYGGWDNIEEYSNCSTRLRYIVKDGSKVNESVLKKAGAMGVVRLSDKSIQTIVGVEAESINNEIVENIGTEI
ncbi:PTS transporter subunit EIIC [Mycoplasmopsis alligatoris]|uniref:PTS system glucose-specific EIICBA component family protein n=1 Tax=Mycoplasmopsis alligatoris A21JP2 TaxID=747682 RepID=D4XVS5_9BACT|nr:PTS transporter subunit EIIC [Mycoplasmopsis alligatoris]EFF41553.1 PTS system glucose-specific EIICBA component family protein [Mycoplasmopsis alligatoris A21JP2]